MKYFIIHHQHKGAPIEKAMLSSGYRFAFHKPDIALFDHAINRLEPNAGRNVITRFYTEGSTIIMYPHAATGAWWMDGGIYAKNACVNNELVIAEGQKKVSKIIDPSMSVHTIGWYYCPIKEFQRPTELKRILFAPIHAPLKGHFREEGADVNKRVYKALLKMSDKYQIIVRHIHSLERSGLWYDSKPVFKLGDTNGAYDDIDMVDLVIAEGTFMYMSVARGKPTIGMNQHVPIRPNNGNTDFVPQHWSEYGEYMGYPIDFDDGDIINLIDKAMEEQTAWKKLFIGEQMQPKGLCKTLEHIRKSDVGGRNA